jgi:hypothetical protein
LRACLEQEDPPNRRTRLLYLRSVAYEIRLAWLKPTIESEVDTATEIKLRQKHSLDYFAERIEYLQTEEFITSHSLPWKSDFLHLYLVYVAVGINIIGGQLGLCEYLVRGVDMHYPFEQLKKFLRDEVKPTRPDLAKSIGKWLINPLPSDIRGFFDPEKYVVNRF